MSYRKITKQETIDKWQPVLDSMGITGSRADWMSEYAQAHSISESDSNSVWQQQQTLWSQHTATSSNPFASAVLPLVRRVAAQTLSMGDEKLLEEAVIKVTATNRDRKIDSILFDEDYEELKLEDTEEYQEYLKSGLASVQPISAPTGLLFYLDFKYDNKK